MQDRKPLSGKETAEPSPRRSEHPAEPQGFAGASPLARQVLTLQRQVGNRQVQRMVASGAFVQRQPAPARAEPAVAGQPAQAPEVPAQYQMTEENVLKTVEALYGASAADLVRGHKTANAGAAVEVKIPIDESLLQARSLNQELAVRFFNAVSPVDVKRWEVERLIGHLGWQHLASESQARAIVESSLQAKATAIGYQTNEGAIRSVQVGLYRLRAQSWLRLERAYADLRNSHYAEDAIASFYIAHVNGAVEVLNGLLDLPVTPYNLVQRIRGKEGVKFLGRIPKLDYVGEYGKKHGQTLETGVVVGFAVFGLRGGGAGAAPGALGLSRGAAAAPEAAGALSKVLQSVSKLQVGGVNVGPALEKALRISLLASEGADVANAVLDVKDAVQALRNGGYVQADGTFRPLTDQDVTNILVSLFMAGVTLKQALPEGAGAPPPHGAPPPPTPDAAPPAPDAPAPKAEPPAPEPKAAAPEAPLPSPEPVLPPPPKAEPPAPEAPKAPEPPKAPEAPRSPEAPPAAASPAPARPAPPHASVDELITPDGTGFTDPQLQASYRKYLARKAKEGKPPANPRQWAALTREGPRERLEQLLGSDYDFSVHATGRPMPPVKLADVQQPAGYTPERLAADLATVTADRGALFHRLGNLLANGITGGETSHALFNILKGNIGEILARPLQTKRLAEIRKTAPDAQLFTDVRARLVDADGKLSDPVLFTDNVIASQRPGGLQLHSVFEVKAGSHGGQEATSQIHRWIEKHLDDGFEIHVGGQWYRYGAGPVAPGKGVVGLARAERHIITPKGAEHYGKGSEDITVVDPARHALPLTADEINFLTRRILETLVPNHPAPTPSPAPTPAPTLPPAPAATPAPPVRRSADPGMKDGGALDPEVESSIQRARGAGQALDSGVRSQMEPAFGSDLGGVRVHTGPEADRLNRAVSARAFTTGSDIFFRQGEYDPGSSAGRELLAHELTHVVQQRGAPVQAKLTLGPVDDPAEREADDVAKQVMRSEPARPEREAEGIARQARKPEAPPAARQAVEQALGKYRIKVAFGRGANLEAAAKAVAAVEETAVGLFLLKELRTSIAHPEFPFQLKVVFVEDGAKIEGHEEGGAAGAATPGEAGWLVQAHTSHSEGTVVERLADTLFHELLHVWFQDVYTPRERAKETLDLPYGMETGHSTDALYGFKAGGAIEFKGGDYHKTFRQMLERFNAERRKSKTFRFEEK